MACFGGGRSRCADAPPSSWPRATSWSAPASTGRRCCATAKRRRRASIRRCCTTTSASCTTSSATSPSRRTSSRAPPTAPALAALASYNRGLALRAAGGRGGRRRGVSRGRGERRRSRLAPARRNRGRGWRRGGAAGSAVTRAVERVAEPDSAHRRARAARPRRASAKTTTSTGHRADAYVDLSDPTQPRRDARRAARRASCRPSCTRPTCSATRPAIRSFCSATTWTARSTMRSSANANGSRPALVDGRRHRARRARAPPPRRRYRVLRRQPSRDELRSRRRSGARGRDRGRRRDRHRGRQRPVLVYRRRECRATSRIRWAASRGGSICEFERDEYERTENVANFDHDYFYTGVDIDYDFSDVMTLRFGLRQYRTPYDDRPARDLTGALLDTNPAQEYAHRGVQLGVTRQLGRAVELEADYLSLTAPTSSSATTTTRRTSCGSLRFSEPTPRFD